MSALLSGGIKEWLSLTPTLLNYPNKIHSSSKSRREIVGYSITEFQQIYELLLYTRIRIKVW